MTNKEIKEKLANMFKDKYIYQRYNGEITKYRDDGKHYINCEIGLAFKKDDNLFYGKISENLIDLVEIGDILKIKTGLYSGFVKFIDNEEDLVILKEQAKRFWIIEEILTHELYEANCYKVGGEDDKF